jgi:hypothetical protein
MWSREPVDVIQSFAILRRLHANPVRSTSLAPVDRSTGPLICPPRFAKPDGARSKY